MGKISGPVKPKRLVGASATALKPTPADSANKATKQSDLIRKSNARKVPAEERIGEDYSRAGSLSAASLPQPALDASMNLSWERRHPAGVFLNSTKQAAGETPALPGDGSRDPLQHRKRQVGHHFADSNRAYFPAPGINLNASEALLGRRV
jgi:hypothetical protein